MKISVNEASSMNSTLVHELLDYNSVG